jgi:integrase
VKTISKLQHLSKTNQKAIGYRLTRLNKLVDLQNPIDVQKAIYGMECRNNYKNKLLLAYQYFCNANGIEFARPKRLPSEVCVISIPTEERIDTIIACCGWVYSVAFSLSKYGLRPHELSKLTLRNIDLEQCKLTVPTSKLGAQRTLSISSKVAEMLRAYINKKHVDALDKRLFAKADKIKARWRFYRKRAYDKFKDRELLKIRLYDLRHWFATTTYVKTRDIFYVKYALGHRRIENTMIYIHLANIAGSNSEDYCCNVAKTVEEARTLVEQGFEYVTEIDGFRLFRKRK